MLEPGLLTLLNEDFLRFCIDVFDEDLREDLITLLDGKIIDHKRVAIMINRVTIKMFVITLFQSVGVTKIARC